MNNVLIGDICRFYKGASIPREKMHDCGDYLYLHYGDLYKDFEIYIDIEHPTKDIPFVSSENNIKDIQFVNNGDIVYILTSETVEDLGKALMIVNANGQKIVSGMETTIMKIKDKSVVNPAYLNYILQMPRFKLLLQQYVTGMKVFRVHPRDISRIYVDIPTISIQNKIVNILSSFDKKIELNTRINQKLEEYVQAIYSKMFNLKKITDIQKDDWSIKTLLNNNLCKVIKPGINKFDGHKTYYPTAEVNNLNIGQGKDITFVKRESRANMQPSCFSVWFAKMKGSVKHIILGKHSDIFIDNSILSTGFCGLQCNENSFEYVATYIRNKNFEIQKNNFAHGTTMEAVNLTDLDEIIILEPDNNTLNKFHNIAKPIYNQINLNMQENIKLSNLRDTLLPKFMSGEIDI